MKPADFQNIGQYLRESRESLRLSIEQASMALHIRAKYLKALESGDLSDLPGKAYIRGYIRNYADYLRLNPGEVLEAYAPVLGGRHEFFIPEPTLRQNLPGRSAVGLSLIGLFLLYGCWYFYGHDRTQMKRMVADLPVKLVHLLDKTPAVAMDKSWHNCLSDGDALCFITLRGQQYIPHKDVPYAIIDADSKNAPLNP